MLQEILDQIGLVTPLVLGLGFAVGIQHAFEADHIAAVSTLIAKSKVSKSSKKTMIKEAISKSSLLGLFWGAGHTTTLVLIGFLVYFVAITIQNSIFWSFELSVGIMLVLLGTTTIVNKKITLRHKHPHRHVDGTIHFDEHNHHDSNHRHNHKSYLIGMIHGLAGSGSLVVLSASTLENTESALGFVTVFGIGSILGMILVSSIIGLPIVFRDRIKQIQKIFRFVAGGLSLVIGMNIIYQMLIIGKSYIGLNL